MNASCKIKAVRGKVNFIEVNSTINKEIHDVILSLQLFYKYGTIFRPYLIDYHVNICKIFAKNAVFDNKVEELVAKSISTIKKNICHPCPYVKGTTIIKWSADQTFSTLMETFKFFLPAGNGKFFFNFIFLV